MNNVLDKFIDDLEKNLAANKTSQNTGMVTIAIADYNELLYASALLDVLQNAFISLDSYDFKKVAGAILGEDKPEPVSLPEDNQG